MVLKLPSAAKTYFNHSLKIRTEEKWDRVSLNSRIVQHPVQCRDIQVIRPSLQLISYVDDEAAFLWWCRDPVAVSAHNLKSTNIIRCQDCED